MTMAAMQSQEEEDVFVEPRQLRRPRAAPNAWSINVFAVEDDEADASLMLDVLRRHPNVSSATVFDEPDEALFQLASGRFKPDLILVDIMMPKVNGFKFLEALCEIPFLRDTPAVMLTTSRFAKDVERARESIACAYIVKPDSYEELKQRLDHAVSRAIDGKWGA
jgi:CheY-like chemotaxis protein